MSFHLKMSKRWPPRTSRGRGRRQLHSREAGVTKLAPDWNQLLKGGSKIFRKFFLSRQVPPERKKGNMLCRERGTKVLNVTLIIKYMLIQVLFIY